MLVDQISDSLKRLELGISIENAQTLKKDLDTFYEKIKTHENEIKAYMSETQETKRALGISTEEKEHLINYLRRFCNDALDGKRELVLQDLQNIEASVGAGNKELRLIWSNYRFETYSASLNLITALLNVMDEDERLDKLGELRTSIENKSIGSRKTVEEIKKFRELTEELIESRQMKPEVQDFVKRLAAGEDILLYQITEEIYSWIRTNKLDKKISLSINM